MYIIKMFKYYDIFIISPTLTRAWPFFPYCDGVDASLCDIPTLLKHLTICNYESLCVSVNHKGSQRLTSSPISKVLAHYRSGPDKNTAL